LRDKPTSVLSRAPFAAKGVESERRREIVWEFRKEEGANPTSRCS
jgi:hypothetical protein